MDADISKTIAPLHYFPDTGWVRCFIESNEFLIEQHDTYQKRTGRNRCRLMGPRGIFTMSIPLQQGKTRQLYRDVCIAYAEPWQLVHWRGLQTAYGKSPFFIHFADELKLLFNRQPKFLFDWNLHCLETMISLAGISARYGFTKSWQMEYPGYRDLRFDNQLKSSNKSSQEYVQVFADKFPFSAGLSALDKLFCTGSLV